VLSPEEQDRAERFSSDRDRRRFIVARALLRSLLGHYLAAAPGAVEIEYGAEGKPQLRGGGLSFNLSHAGEIALFAFSVAGDVGVDVELDEAGLAGERLAQRERLASRFFSAAENRDLRSLPSALRARAFLTCWTRKEAFVKARGDGLKLPLHSFDVTLSPRDPAAVLRTDWSAEEPAYWRLYDVSELAAGYIAAVAIRGECSGVIRREVCA